MGRVALQLQCGRYFYNLVTNLLVLIISFRPICLSGSQKVSNIHCPQLSISRLHDGRCPRRLPCRGRLCRCTVKGKFVCTVERRQSQYWLVRKVPKSTQYTASNRFRKATGYLDDLLSTYAVVRVRTKVGGGDFGGLVCSARTRRLVYQDEGASPCSGPRR